MRPQAVLFDMLIALEGPEWRLLALSVGRDEASLPDKADEARE